MAYLRYQRYKPTADAWLGDVPAHWIVTSLRRYFMVKSGDMISTLDMEDEGYPVFGGNGFRGRYADWNTEPDTLIIGRYGALCGNARVTTERIWATEHAFRAIPVLPYSPRFFCYLVEAIDLNKFSARSAQPGLNSELVRANACAVPPPDEQDVIADFLDRETARIDALIDKKRRLLDLLEEKRLAVITHAVTKGLDPNAPMKDSGIECLGRVPAHWQVKRLKYISPKVTVGIVVTPAAYYVESGITALRGFNIKERSIDLSDVAFISEEANELHAKSQIFEGDLVAVRTGQPGTTAVVPEDLDGANCVDLIIIRHSPDMLPEFAAYFANSDPAKMQYGSGSEGALQQHFNIDTAKNLDVPVPPLPEQEAIVSHLVSEEGKIRHAMSMMQGSVDTLTEYRSALITNAVTGKIDVRDEVKKEAAA